MLNFYLFLFTECAKQVRNEYIIRLSVVSG
jgi:hypothetical protein